MKQVAMLLALVVTGSLSTGCGRCDPAEIAVYWTFTDASNQATTSCAAAGVSTIRIFVNDVPQYDYAGRQDLSCAAYGDGAIVPRQTSSDRVQVEAYDTSGNLLYLARDVVAAQTCGVTTYSASLAAQQGPLTVNLAGVQCPLQSYVWYSLTDVTDPANPVSYSVVDAGGGNATSVPCVTALRFDGLPFGDYQFDFIQIVHPTSLQPGAQFVADFQNCAPQPFTHARNDAVTVTLTPATTVCAP